MYGNYLINTSKKKKQLQKQNPIGFLNDLQKYYVPLRDMRTIIPETINSNVIIEGERKMNYVTLDCIDTNLFHMPKME